MKLLHASEEPIRQLSDAISVSYIKSSNQMVPLFDHLNDRLESLHPYKPEFLNDYCPNDARKRYNFLQCLKEKGLQFPVLVLTYSSGNNVGKCILCGVLPFLKP